MTDTNYIEVLRKLQAAIFLPGDKALAELEAEQIRALDAAITALSARASAGEGGEWAAMDRVYNFLMGIADLDGASFGEDHPKVAPGRYWWRHDLAAAYAAARKTAAPQPAQAGASGGGENASVVLRLRRILADSEAGRISGLGDTCEDAINSAIEHIEASEVRALAFCRKHGLDPDSPVDVAGIGVTLPRWKAWEADAERDALDRSHEEKYATAERVAKPAATAKCDFCGARPDDLHAFDCTALDTTPASPATGEDDVRLCHCCGETFDRCRETYRGDSGEWDDGVKACIAWVEKRRHDFESEYGMVDPSTGAMEFRSVAKEEYDCELGEIEEGLRSLLTAAPRPQDAPAQAGASGDLSTPQPAAAQSISARENGLLCDMEMFAHGRDIVTGDPITMDDVKRIASGWLAAAPQLHEYPACAYRWTGKGWVDPDGNAPPAHGDGEGVKIDYITAFNFAKDNGLDYNRLCAAVREMVTTRPTPEAQPPHVGEVIAEMRQEQDRAHLGRFGHRVRDWADRLSTHPTPEAHADTKRLDFLLDNCAVVKTSDGHHWRVEYEWLPEGTEGPFAATKRAAIDAALALPAQGEG